MPFGRLERTAAPAPMSDINMTPLIDVMLVLLVIFMIAAPLMASSLKLDLPASDAATPADAGEFLSLAMTADGALQFGEGTRTEAIDEAALDARLAEAARRQPGIEVQLRADEAVAYGRVAALIGRLQAAGLNRIAFVARAEPPPR
ncbi:MAG TPA: biopolymer transporter ExbD [Methylibium sp.]|uniref:ExbD/TolR family protein n=1 Tax=Methylibium sp. TaxID=2067992 RepID=UPI002DBB1594|nr:biopolymer transporter ExbD [Methylibium sp.]HEU4460410.1 biopolymer transporter ExbD [Methylibium sp.]